MLLEPSEALYEVLFDCQPAPGLAGGLAPFVHVLFAPVLANPSKFWVYGDVVNENVCADVETKLRVISINKSKNLFNIDLLL
jgi:hypothetical protein